MDKDDLLCVHLGYTWGELEEIIKKKNLKTFEDVQDETDAGTVCGSCRGDIEDLLDEINNK